MIRVHFNTTLRTTLLTCAVAAIATVSIAQTSITGALLNEAGQPVPFAHVALTSGGSAVTSTDVKGSFTVEIDQWPAELLITSVGFMDHTEALNNSNDAIGLNITLKEAVIGLPQFTVNGSMTNGEHGARETSGSAWYIGPKQIQEFAYTDVGRLLRTVPGVHIQEEDGFGLRPNIGLRGTGSERSEKITLMEDGVLIAPAPYSAPAAYYFPTLGRMNGVEVVKGSSQIQYGPLTTGGAIDLLSTPIPLSSAGRVSLHAGSFGLRELHANAGMTKGQFGMLVETFQQGSDGFKELDTGDDTGFNKQDYLIKAQVKSKPTAKLQQAVSIKANLTNERSNETYLGLSTDDFKSTPYRRYAGSQQDLMKVEHELFTLGWQARPTENMELNITAYRTNTARNWYKLDKVVDGDGNTVSISSLLESPGRNLAAYNIINGVGDGSEELQVKANNRHYQSSGIAFTGKQSWNREKLTHTLEVGTRLHNDHMDRYQWVDGYTMQNGTMLQSSKGIPGTESNRFHEADALAAHLLYEARFKKWKINTGSRYEHIEMKKDDFGMNDPDRTASDLNASKNKANVLIPGASVLRELGHNWNAFIGVHQGFAPPGTTADAKPETSVNYEAGIRHHGALDLQVIGFFNDYSELLGSDLAAAGGTGSGEVFNAGEAEVKGIEVSVEQDLLNGSQPRWMIPFRINYTYTDARFANTFSSAFGPWSNVIAGDRIPYTPEHQFNFFVGMRTDKVELNTSTSFVSAMSATTSPTENTEFNEIPGHWISDINVNWNLTKMISLSASAINVFDQVYTAASRPAGLRPGAPRMFRIGYMQRF